MKTLQLKNRTNKSRWRRACLPLAACLTLAALVGCDSPKARFRVNRVFVQKQLNATGAEEVPIEQLNDAYAAMEAVFGTPDKAEPAETPLGIDAAVDVNLLKMAAGPVGREDDGSVRGLYREHCAHCHGVTGDGRGPTAEFLNPYPRDFRLGVFKFKSTPKLEKPTDADLRKTLVEGIPGTAMPSFKLLPEDQLNSLIAYVKYLAIRGEFERALVTEVTEVLDPDEDLNTNGDYLVDEVLSGIVDKWARANESATAVPARPKMDDVALVKSIERGRTLFMSTTANCFNCHGVTALGDGQASDYDDWTKDFEDWTKPMEDAVRARKVDQYLAMGGLPIRNAIPRNLRQGVYRGGRRPVDIYWRIKNGIEGSPMPAAASSLSNDDLWDIVNYVLYLPYETLSQPPEDVLENLRQNP